MTTILTLLLCLLGTYYFTIIIALIVPVDDETWKTKGEFRQDLIPFRRWIIAIKEAYEKLED